MANTHAKVVLTLLLLLLMLLVASLGLPLAPQSLKVQSGRETQQQQK